jgi:Protein kinase domain
VSLSFLRPPIDPGHLGRIGGYDVLEVIGRGGMGVVLKAFDPALRRMVAVKVLAPQLAANVTARQRFAREATHTAQVRHENVVAIHAVAEVDGLPYLVMEYVPGESLQERLDRAGPLDLEDILRIGMQTAAGLAAAHEQGVIHRDVKPANILLDDVGNVKLTDFGLARAVDDASLTQTGVIAGTSQFMAPEQARGGTLDHRADLFSLGSVLYTMCAGRPPFRAPTTLAVIKRVCEDTPHSIADLNPRIPEWLIEIIAKLHAKSPAERFQSAAEVAELLHQHLRHLRSPNTVKWPAPLTRRSAPARRLKWVVALVFAIVATAPLVACGAIAYWLVNQGEGDAPPQHLVDEPPFAEVLQDLDSNNVFKCIDAAKSLATMKPNEQRAEVAAKLADLVEADNPHIRVHAVAALAVWATHKEAAVLIRMLDHKDVFTRQAALKGVGRFRDEKSQLPIMRCFQDFQTRADAAHALRDFGPQAEKEVLGLLNKDDVFLKQDAINVLRDIGTEASVPALKAAVASDNVFLAGPAREALKAIAARARK